MSKAPCSMGLGAMMVACDAWLRLTIRGGGAVWVGTGMALGKKYTRKNKHLINSIYILKSEAKAQCVAQTTNPPEPLTMLTPLLILRIGRKKSRQMKTTASEKHLQLNGPNAILNLHKSKKENVSGQDPKTLPSTLGSSSFTDRFFPILKFVNHGFSVL